MTKINEFEGKKFNVETTLSGLSPVRGVATICASWGNLCWGELRLETGIIRYHTFFLTLDKKGKVEKCTVNSNERFPDPGGNWQLDRTVGSKEEVKTLYEILIGTRIENDKLAEYKLSQQKTMQEMAESKIKKGQEIKAKRQELKDKLLKLSAGKSIDEQLSDKDLIKVTQELSVFNALYPERQKK